MNVTEQKRALRAQYLSLRASLEKQERDACDAALCRRIASLSAFSESDLVLGFCAVRGEPDLTALYELALQRGKKLAFPRCEGQVMRFHTVASLAELTAGRFGIPAPAPDAPPALLTPHTLCILPALAATSTGERLGYGGGFYDRFLPHFCGRTVLPIYEKFLCPTLPQEATDRAADCILTEKGVLFGA